MEAEKLLLRHPHGKKVYRVNAHKYHVNCPASGFKK